MAVNVGDMFYGYSAIDDGFYKNTVVQIKHGEKVVHCIWFCIDAQSKRVSEESLNYLYKISKMWEGVPIIVVFTKSYSTIAIKENEEMFQKVLAKYQKRKTLKPSRCKVIPILLYSRR